MSLRYEELDYQDTAMGEISLRRRHDPVVDKIVYEVRLGDEYLMSSLFTASEIELARLGLAAHDGSSLRVIVGGLGLGYTARAALEDPRVTALTVIEAAEPVIAWNRRGLVRETAGVAADQRCHLVHGDFFALVRRGADTPRADVVLLDIDHTPEHLLHPSHADLYTAEGLRRMGGLLAADGVFALWSDDPPETSFSALLEEAFRDTSAHVVTFPNPLTGGESACTVYLARHPVPTDS